MKLRLIFLLALSVFAVIIAAGCVDPATTSGTPIPTSTMPLPPSDSAAGNWTGVWNDQNGTEQTTITYTITVENAASGNVAYVKKIKDGFSSSTFEYSISAEIVRSGNEYSLDAQLLGIYVFSLTGDNSATLLTPEGATVSMTKV
ncbi:MAG: hypothetical protein VB020_05940 [Methanocorpusculum sp.]|nr:hypothetical protein [Methanocorpusculum sp.]